MRIVAIGVALSIVFFAASGWSDAKYFKIPTPPEAPDKGQSTTPQKPPEATPPPQNKTETEKPRVETPAKPAEAKSAGQPIAPPEKKPPKTVRTKKQKPRDPYMTSLQISSFRTLDQAREEESRLKALDIDAFIRHEAVRGKGMWYRIYIGRFKSKRQALDYEKELKRKGIIRWSWIKRLRVTPVQAPVAPAPAVKPSPAAKAAATRKPDQKTDRKPFTAAAKPKRPVVPPTTESPTPPSKKPTQKAAPKDKTLQPGRFYFGPRAGLLFAPGASDFRITRTIGSDTEYWEFEDIKPILGLNIGWRFSDHWSVDTVVEKVVLANLEMEHHTLGPKVYVSDSGRVKPYLRAALVYGRLSWDDAPGDFDSTIGAEAGFGVDFIGSDYSFGVEAAYRYISFDYTPPSGTSVTATDSQIDFSGFTLTGCARAHF